MMGYLYFTDMNVQLRTVQLYIGHYHMSFDSGNTLSKYMQRISVLMHQYFSVLHCGHCLSWEEIIGFSGTWFGMISSAWSNVD